MQLMSLNREQQARHAYLMKTGCEDHGMPWQFERAPFSRTVRMYPSIAGVQGLGELGKGIGSVVQ